MKRVRCPKCDNYITFDETKYQSGQSLVFECPECGHKITIDMNKCPNCGVDLAFEYEDEE